VGGKGVPRPSLGAGRGGDGKGGREGGRGGRGGKGRGVTEGTEGEREGRGGDVGQGTDLAALAPAPEALVDCARVGWHQQPLADGDGAQVPGEVPHSLVAIADVLSDVSSLRWYTSRLPGLHGPDMVP